jgi:hemerythrin-like domain-containing protein
LEQLLNSGIKQIIDEHAEVGPILEAYGIGCVPCSVGTCLLKDIVDIHGLSATQEQALMTKIAKAVYPDRDIVIPLRAKTSTENGTDLTYSPPMKKLVDEHTWIKRLLAQVPNLIRTLDLTAEPGRQLVRDVLDFIRNYADRFHHAKEEDILFKYFDEKLDILQVMLTDHESGRSHVRAIAGAVEKQDAATVSEHLAAYRELLTEHIKKENEILYPWMDKEMSDSQIGQMFAAFSDVDVTFGDGPGKHIAFVETLEALNS